MNFEEPHMKTVFRLLVLVFCLMVPDISSAQVEQQEDPFGSLLYTPEEIMQHRRAIDLNDEQRDGITRLIEELQGRLVGLQWRLLDETEAVKEALEGPRVDLDRVMDRFGKALDTEMEIKRVHIELLIRIKNILSPGQQAELLRLRETDLSEHIQGL
jgi:Spy/CpxP family protein refolding chaperone